nr:hypothetical protein Itr_chr10CG12350 [Ipomoea trifida]
MRLNKAVYHTFPSMDTSSPGRSLEGNQNEFKPSLIGYWPQTIGVRNSVELGHSRLFPQGAITCRFYCK